MMGIVVPETCWAYKTYNKIISGMLLVFILLLSPWCTVQQTPDWRIQPEESMDIPGAQEVLKQTLINILTLKTAWNWLAQQYQYVSYRAPGDPATISTWGPFLYTQRRTLTSSAHCRDSDVELGEYPGVLLHRPSCQVSEKHNGRHCDS